MKAGPHRKIRSLSTTVELMKFYKQKHDKEFYEYYKERLRKAFLDFLEMDLPLGKKVRMFKYFILFIRHLGVKNTLYYFLNLFK